MKKLLFILIIVLVNKVTFSQTNREGKNIQYYKEIVFGLNINTNGWTIPSVRWGKFLTITHKRIIETEFSGIKHPKEVRQSKPFSSTGGLEALPPPKSFIYGKQSSFYTIRTGIGNMNVLFEKAKKNGVEVRYVYLIGSSLGLLKPYYLNFLYDINDIYYIEPEKYDQDVPNEQNIFLDNSSPAIYGSAGFGRGLDEIKIIPGAYGKLAMNFEWAKFYDLIYAVEVGAIVDMYAKKVPIMILENNNQFFLSFYISVLIGKKW